NGGWVRGWEIPVRAGPRKPPAGNPDAPGRIASRFLILRRNPPRGFHRRFKPGGFTPAGASARASAAENRFHFSALPAPPDSSAEPHHALHCTLPFSRSPRRSCRSRPVLAMAGLLRFSCPE